MKRSEIFLMVLQLPIDFLMLLLAATTAYYLRFTNWALGLKPVLFDLTLLEFLNIGVWVAILWLIIFALLGLYSTNPNRKFSTDIKNIVIGCTAGVAIIALIILFTGEQFDSRFLVAASWGFAIVFVLLGRLVIRAFKGALLRAGWGLRRVVLVGVPQTTASLAQVLEKRPELGYKVIKIISRFDSKAKSILSRLRPDEVIFTNPRDKERQTLSAIQFCSQKHITVKYSADLFAAYSSKIVVHPLAGIPMVELRKTPLDGWGRVAKRLFDLLLGLVVIIIVSPVMILTAIVIFIETGTPIIYKNERVGIRGRKFFTLKFRSMYKEDCTGTQFGLAGAKAQKKEKTLIKKQSIKEGPIYKIANDPRVTPFGRIIRRFSIDELPQFFNVLGGSMSIVGPRPHQPREVAHYEDGYKKVLTLKPGISGLAQISGRSDLTFDEEMNLDIFYIENWSLHLDFIIFIKTPFVLLKKRKAL